MLTLSQSMEILESKIETYRREAFGADKRHKKVKSKLLSFSLWKRILFFSRFNKLRNRLSHYELKRAFCTIKMLQYQKQLKVARRHLDGGLTIR